MAACASMTRVEPESVCAETPSRWTLTVRAFEPSVRSSASPLYLTLRVAVEPDAVVAGALRPDVESLSPFSSPVTVTLTPLVARSSAEIDEAATFS